MLYPRGKFVGNATVQVEWLVANPRPMVLTRRLEYVDCDGTHWVADAGRIINGASVPWFFRRVFPAYIGPYRRASVLHDVACEDRNQPSWKVHHMFWEVMRYDGTGPVKAWLMWAAVWAFGPEFKGIIDDEA